jgi:hypothetical protein
VRQGLGIARHGVHPIETVEFFSNSDSNDADIIGAFRHSEVKHDASNESANMLDAAAQANGC